ncbi:SUN domain-containing protein 2 isoform X1 [Scophthalmus maximus]|uniref:SUN domain-containing protein 2 isoform X1 n=2 Tax=Scophthalmus maximus TaxID=52904 RepID=UPI001FA8F49F|nr:SUN domain-containing protein 2 isoform X1 [Scophthalmus maximus]XP_035493357.2 SUN domain-containing protein 2 isoform X1 [Scophthalmus maximus]
MSRRSSRLMSGGYYHSDEESDSSSVTNISYREIPVKVFKKKAGTRKPSSRTSSRANSNASSPVQQSPVPAGQFDGRSPSPASGHTQPTMRTEPFAFTTATPRPALTPSSTRSRTPTRCPSVPPEKSPLPGHHGPSRPGLHPRPGHKEPLSRSGVDSSGYSSSEGPYRKPTGRTSDDPSPGYRSRISSAFFSLMDSASLMAVAAQSKIMHLKALANTSLSSRVKKACGLSILLLLLVLLCIWFLLPLLTSFVSHMRVAKTPSLTKPESRPVVPATSPPPPPQPNTMHHSPVVDPAVVSAAVEAKMQHLSAELLLKQEMLYSQMKERIKLDMQGIKSSLEVVDLDSRLRLEQEIAGLGRQMVEYQTDSRSAAASLSSRIRAVEAENAEVKTDSLSAAASLSSRIRAVEAENAEVKTDSRSAAASLISRIHAVEAENAKLSQQLVSIQLIPPPAPCPETSTAPVHNHLTPELQQAMEKWLTDRIKERDVLKGSGADFGRPMADKMADFALETQGASVISTRCSETYHIRSACVTLFGFPLWYPSESPRTVIQGYPVLLPGKCWAFNGVQGTLVISLSHPVRITHVTLDHLPRYNSPTGRIDSAPKDFEVYGTKSDTQEGTLLGTFTYNENGESTQTFQLPNPSDEVYRFVELHVLSNWGHVEYTCLYRFRVHGKIATT